MKLILASSNKGKIKEIKEIYKDIQIIPYSNILEPFEIIEDGVTFQQNALIKARAIYDKLDDKSLIVLADDSGISVNELQGEPGIYSARYAGINANDNDNLDKLIQKLKQKNIISSKAHYTAAIALIVGGIEYTVHGWMYGDVITTARGDHGFGYDPIFIPGGYDKTLGELSHEIKIKLSHRFQALKLAKIVLDSTLYTDS